MLEKLSNVHAAAEPQSARTIEAYGSAARYAIRRWLMSNRYRKHPGADLLVDEATRERGGAIAFSLVWSDQSQLLTLMDVVLGDVEGHVVVSTVQHANRIFGQPLVLPSPSQAGRLGDVPAKPSLFVQMLKPWLLKYMELVYEAVYEAVMNTLPMAQAAAEPVALNRSQYMVHVYTTADSFALQRAMPINIAGVTCSDVRWLNVDNPGDASSNFDVSVHAPSRLEVAKKIAMLLLAAQAKLEPTVQFGHAYAKCTANTRAEILALAAALARKALSRTVADRQVQAAAEPHRSYTLPDISIITDLDTDNNYGSSFYAKIELELTKALNKFGFVAGDDADWSITEDEEFCRFVARDIQFRGSPGSAVHAFAAFLTYIHQNQSELRINIDHRELANVAREFARALKDGDEVVIGSYSAPTPAVEINVDFEPEQRTARAAAEPTAAVNIATQIHFMTNISSDLNPDRYTDCVETTLKRNKFTAHISVDADDGDDDVPYPSYVVTVRDLQFHGPRSGVGAALKAWLTELKKSRFSQALYEAIDIADILTHVAHRDEQVEAAAEPSASAETTFAFNIVAEAPGTHVLKYMKHHLRDGYDHMSCLDGWKTQPGGEFAVFLRGPVHDVKKRFLEVVTKLLHTEGVKELAHHVIVEHGANHWLSVKPGDSNASVQAFVSGCAAACKRESLKLYDHPAFGGNIDRDMHGHKLRRLFSVQAAAEPNRSSEVSASLSFTVNSVDRVDKILGDLKKIEGVRAYCSRGITERGLRARWGLLEIDVATPTLAGTLKALCEAVAAYNAKSPAKERFDLTEEAIRRAFHSGRVRQARRATAAAEPSASQRPYLDWLGKYSPIGAPKCPDMKLKFKGRDIMLSQDNAWSRDRIEYSFSVERGTFIKFNVTTAPATKPAFSVYLGPDVAHVFSAGGMFEIGRTKTGPDLQRTILAALQLIEKSINDLVHGHTKRDRTGQKPGFMFNEADFILTGKLKRRGILVFENWNTKLGQRKNWEVTAAELEDLVWSRGRADWFKPLLERAAAEWRNSSQETNNAL